MFPKREPQKGEVYCPYDGIAYSKVPGYISGYGCPVCGAIGQYHLPIQKNRPTKDAPDRLAALAGVVVFFGFILLLAMVLIIIGGR